MSNCTDVLSAMSVQLFPITNERVESMQHLSEGARKAEKCRLCLKAATNVALPLIFGALSAVGAAVGARYITNLKYRGMTQIGLGVLGGLSLGAAGINALQLINICAKKPRKVDTVTG